MASIHPTGFEPVTFGSVDRSSMNVYMTWTLLATLLIYRFLLRKTGRNVDLPEKPSVFIAEGFRYTLYLLALASCATSMGDNKMRRISSSRRLRPTEVLSIYEPAATGSATR